MRQSSPLASPVLVGAVTILVVFVAVFLAYNANTGLPFVPTTQLVVQLPSGANVVNGNEVRTGGLRIGTVQEMKPVRLPDGRVIAEAVLKLDTKVGRIPVDSTIETRARSALGLKYLDLRQGNSSRMLRDGDTLPLSQSETDIELADVLSTFDERTRRASRGALEGFGDAFAARGTSLNRTIAELPELLRELEPVMANLDDRDTRLERFFEELADTVRIVAPVADVQGPLFRDQATTFEAISRDPGALQATIEKSPPTLDASIRSFRVQRPFLRDLAALSEDLSGAARSLRTALPAVNDALVVGADVQKRVPALNERLEGLLDAVRDVARAPGTNAGLRGIDGFGDTLNPQVRFYGPFVTVCNYWNSWWTYLAEHFSEPNATGSGQRALINTVGRQDNSLGSMGAWEQASGRNVTEGNAQFMQGQVYTAAVTEDGEADCEAGQRGWLEDNARFLGNKTLRVNLDARTPGAQGPTFTGRARVPEGQTFTHTPETGAYSLEENLPTSEALLPPGSEAARAADDPTQHGN